MLGEFADGHDFEEDMAKDALPAVGDDLASGGGYDALEGVEEAVLSGIDGMDHSGRNSFSKIWLSIECRPGRVKEKNGDKVRLFKELRRNEGSGLLSETSKLGSECFRFDHDISRRGR